MVASQESQYKVFHFHHGGLDKLSDVFQQWKYCAETHLKDQVGQRPNWGLGGGHLAAGTPRPGSRTSPAQVSAPEPEASRV